MPVDRCDPEVYGMCMNRIIGLILISLINPNTGLSS